MSVHPVHGFVDALVELVAHAQRHLGTLFHIDHHRYGQTTAIGPARYRAATCVAPEIPVMGGQHAEHSDLRDPAQADHALGHEQQHQHQTK